MNKIFASLKTIFVGAYNVIIPFIINAVRNINAGLGPVVMEVVEAIAADESNKGLPFDQLLAKAVPMVEAKVADKKVIGNFTTTDIINLIQVFVTKRKVA